MKKLTSLALTLSAAIVVGCVHQSDTNSAGGYSTDNPPPEQQKTSQSTAAYFFNENVEWENVGPGISRKILPYTDGLMGVVVNFDKGAVGKVHTHDVHDQLAVCLSGSFEVELNGVKRIIKKGDAFLAGKVTPHGVVALEADSQLLDTFNPHRASFVGSKVAQQSASKPSSPISAFFFNESQEWESVGNGISRKILPYTEGLMGVIVNFEKGAVGEVHTHDAHDQLAICLSGSFEIDLGGVKTIIKEGDAFLAGKGAPHGVVALEEGSKLLDTFNPRARS